MVLIDSKPFFFCVEDDMDLVKIKTTLNVLYSHVFCPMYSFISLKNFKKYTSIRLFFSFLIHGLSRSSNSKSSAKCQRIDWLIWTMDRHTKERLECKKILKIVIEKLKG